METIKLITQNVTKKLKVVTNGAVIIITVRPSGNSKNRESAYGESTHVEVGTGPYADRVNWQIVENIQQKQVASVAVKRK